MNPIDEKRLLAVMLRNSGKPDLELEKFLRENYGIGGKPKSEPLVEEPKFIQEVATPPTPPAAEPMGELPDPPKLVVDLHRDEIKGLRKQIEAINQRIGTLSFGGGGTGVVRFYDLDDHQDVLDIIQYKSYASVDTDYYEIRDTDYYVGVDYPTGNVAVVLPLTRDGMRIVVKDESGNCGSNPINWIDIYAAGGELIDGQDYVRLKIDFGSLTFFYRDGWRII